MVEVSAIGRNKSSFLNLTGALLREEDTLMRTSRRLELSEEELSRAEVYTGVESLRYGLIDDIGTSTATIEKAMSISYLPQCCRMTDCMVKSALLT